ncbi:MAG: bifunctional acetate--CoA ligase family protein/GNAT family N-acetyltransferase [Parachlamydiaceae bacterium]
MAFHRTDPSQNFILRHPRPLDAIFQPKNVAVIGAKDDVGSVARTILNNLLDGNFNGHVYAVNPKRDRVLGLKCYSKIALIPEAVDLAIIVTPAIAVPGIVAECVEAKVKAAIVISAGFKELGESGLRLEQEILTYAKSGRMPIIGPNCLGVMNPIFGLNATFARGMALPGNIAFLSQSGAMCTAVLDWSFKERIGFSSFVSVGSMADVDWGDLIDYLGGDPNTHSILMYMETVGNSRSFLSAAREIALEKPIIVIKAGRSIAAAQAAASHTGSLAGSDEVFDAALERVGVLRVNTIAELFQMASLLARQPRPKGPKLSIVTNAGGPAVLATDAVVQHGAELAPLGGQALIELNQFLPEAWSHRNPVDILGDAKPERYAATLDVLSRDPESDGVLVVLSPQDVTDPTRTAEVLRPYAQSMDKPLLASWMGGSSVARGAEILSFANIPMFEYPDDAAAAFATMWRYSKNLEILYQTPSNEGYHLDPKKKKLSQDILLKAREQGATLLDEFESKQVLEGYGIPTVRTEIAITQDEAVALARKMGFPVVLKLFSKTLTHKTDVGGVKLNLKSIDDVALAYKEIKDSVTAKARAEDFHGVTVQQMIKRDGYELILGSSVDAQFGPVILFGAGGQLVEIFKDSALGLPPLNTNLAVHLMRKTKIFHALKGVRGKQGVNLLELTSLLVRFAKMIAENPAIKECDINPLLASADGFVALDARFVLFGKEIRDERLPKLSIRPYPFQYVENWTLRNGVSTLIRPILPEDEPLLVAFHKELSENTVRQRFFEFLSLDDRTSHERLVRICFNDYDRELGLVAEIDDPATKKQRIIGVARLSRFPGSQDAQFTLIISDPFHDQGLGSELVRQMILIARQEGVDTIFANILQENKGMIKVLSKHGFTITTKEKASIVNAELKTKYFT